MPQPTFCHLGELISRNWEKNGTVIGDVVATIGVAILGADTFKGVIKLSKKNSITVQVSQAEYFLATPSNLVR